MIRYILFDCFFPKQLGGNCQIACNDWAVVCTTLSRRLSTPATTHSPVGPPGLHSSLEGSAVPPQGDFCHHTPGDTTAPGPGGTTAATPYLRLWHRCYTTAWRLFRLANQPQSCDTQQPMNIHLWPSNSLPGPL